MKITYHYERKGKVFQKQLESKPRGGFLWGFIARFLLILAGVFVASGISGSAIQYDGLGSLILVSLLVSVFNILLKPVLVLFTLPFVILTFGLGILFINALIFYFVGSIVDGFQVASFWAALWGAFVVSLVSIFFQIFVSGKSNRKILSPQSDNPNTNGTPSSSQKVNRYRPGRDKEDVIDI